MQQGKLQKAFMNSAVTGFFINRSEWLSSWPFVLGYGAMIAKGGLNPDLDTAAGMFMIGAASCFMLQKKYPNVAFRVSAAMGFSAAVCLSLGGLDFETMEITNKWRFFAPFTGPMIANTLIGFQKEFSAFSERHSDSKNKLVSTFAKAVRYPLLTAACVDLCNGPNFMMAAITSKDWVFLGAICVFAVGLLGLIASDPHIQKKYKEFQQSKEPQLKETAVATPALTAR